MLWDTLGTAGAPGDPVLEGGQAPSTLQSPFHMEDELSAKEGWREPTEEGVAKPPAPQHVPSNTGKSGSEYPTPNPVRGLWERQDSQPRSSLGGVGIRRKILFLMKKKYSGIAKNVQLVGKRSVSHPGTQGSF